MSRRRILAAVAAVALTVGGGGLTVFNTLEGNQTPATHAVVASPTAKPSVKYLADLPISMMSINSQKGIYYLGVGSGILTSWDYGAKSVSKNGTLNQEFLIFLDQRQLKEFQAMDGNVGPITEAQAEALSYYAVIYSQRLTISELKAGHPMPNITFRVVLK